MKRFVGFSVIAVLAMSLAAMPVYAQHRGGGGSSRGGGGGSRSGGGGHSSSMSAPSRGGGSSMSRGSSSYSSRSYSSSPSTRSGGYSSGSSSRSRSYSSGPSTRSYSSSPSTRSYSAPQSQQRRSGTYSATPQRQTQSGAVTRSGGSSYQQRSSGTRTVPNSSRGGSSYQQRSSGTRTVPNSSRGGSSQPSRAYAQPQTRSQSGTSRVQASPRTRSQGVPQLRSQGVPQTRSMSPSGRPVAGMRHNPAGGQPQRVVMHGGPGFDHGRIAPRHRDPMPFNRPAPFWGHGRHYFGYPVHYLPGRYHIHRYWGRDYYIIDGLYYRHYLDYYYVCRPPFGVFFDPILDDIAFAACNIAYYASTYNAFRTINENANTITAQNQVIAQNNATIAQQNETIALNSERAAAAQQAADEAGLVQSYADVNTEYFYDDGVFFVKDKSGKYVTIVPPAGALVKELPEDYDTITLEGKEYYKVDDTVFTTSVVNGTVYFEVLGQMTGELADRFDFNK